MNLPMIGLCAALLLTLGASSGLAQSHANRDPADLAWEARLANAAFSCGQRSQQWGWRLDRFVKGALSHTDPATGARTASPPAPTVFRLEGMAAAAEYGATRLFARYDIRICPAIAAEDALSSADADAATVPTSTLMSVPLTDLDPAVNVPFQLADGLWDIEAAELAYVCHLRTERWLNAIRDRMLRGAYVPQTYGNPPGPTLQRAFAQGFIEMSIRYAQWEYANDPIMACYVAGNIPTVKQLDQMLAGGHD